MSSYRDLRPVPLKDVLPMRRGVRYITMREQQWDGVLAEAYRLGWALLEIDADEHVIRAYQRDLQAPAESLATESASKGDA